VLTLEAYLRELVRRVAAVFGADLVGVYAGGSYALDAYEPGRSDIDVAAVVSAASLGAKEALVQELRQESFPCPARGLELVLYRLDAVQNPSPGAAFELNLNTGARMEFRAEYEPGTDEQHWFPLDRSLLRQRGVALHGPPAADVFAPLPRRVLLGLVLAAVRWHSSGAARGDDAVLNACRSWRFAAEAVWSSKREAGAWALRHDAPPIVAEALELRSGTARLDPAAVRRFLDSVAERVEAAASAPLPTGLLA
jgi:Domain of unknown function (DUF4111)/Nucleotidyltransferase domain